MEAVHYLSNQLANDDRAVQRFLSIEDVTIADLRPDDVRTAADLLREDDQAGTDGRDATVLAAMDRHGVSRLWTHDEGLVRMADRLAWLTVTDPVE